MFLSLVRLSDDSMTFAAAGEAEHFSIPRLPHPPAAVAHPCWAGPLCETAGAASCVVTGQVNGITFHFISGFEGL